MTETNEQGFNISSQPLQFKPAPEPDRAYIYNWALTAAREDLARSMMGMAPDPNAVIARAEIYVAFLLNVVGR